MLQPHKSKSGEVIHHSIFYFLDIYYV